MVENQAKSWDTSRNELSIIPRKEEAEMSVNRDRIIGWVAGVIVSLIGWAVIINVVLWLWRWK